MDENKMEVISGPYATATYTLGQSQAWCVS